jgi:predicted nucleic acid-binding protein
VIAYFDTSAIVPILIEEDGSAAAGAIWDQADRLVSVRLARVEARAALAQAGRLGRISAEQLDASKQDLDRLVDQLDLVDIDDHLVERAADLAEEQALRAYDAVHLAAALRLLDDDLILVAGDRALLGAAHAIGIAVAAIG